MSPLGTTLSTILWVAIALLFARMIIGYVVLLARVQATGYLAVLFEVVYTITDIPLRPLDRILPTIRLGAGFAFPLSFPVLLIALYIVRSQVASL